MLFLELGLAVITHIQMAQYPEYMEVPILIVAAQVLMETSINC
jgi:hypothetical protein